MTVNAPNDPRHGTVAGYNRIPCRELCCRAAYTRWRKHWTHDRNNGQTRKVDATGIRRRIQALMALGWSIQSMADTAGTTHRVVQTALRSQSITRAKADRITAMYDRLSMRLPPERTGTERQSAARARNRAHADGWPPPLAWDDETIDDPNSRPYRHQRRPEGGNAELRTVDRVVVERALNGQRVRATPPERAEIARRWARTGRSLNDLDALQGWNCRRDARIRAA